jgi:hypothetical protein
MGLKSKKSVVAVKCVTNTAIIRILAQTSRLKSIKRSNKLKID